MTRSRSEDAAGVAGQPRRTAALREAFLSVLVHARPIRCLDQHADTYLTVFRIHIYYNSDPDF